MQCNHINTITLTELKLKKCGPEGPLDCSNIELVCPDKERRASLRIEPNRINVINITLTELEVKNA